ncbi:hypothetical protein PIB30_079089 [Stylosanthes scabra]|uniref:Uncharacterized protein n=1 Tax=Stylosanthes scabra TaxID=79078 RepID=A0ABU6XQT0_9FABA|nr:hypothetical protein [Stylosanthes scabra]
MTKAESEIAVVVAQMRREMKLRRHHSMSDLTLEEMAEVGEIIKDEIHDEVESEAMAELRKLLEERDSLAEKQEKPGKIEILTVLKNFAQWWRWMWRWRWGGVAVW